MKNIIKIKRLEKEYRELCDIIRRNNNAHPGVFERRNKVWEELCQARAK